MAAVKPRPIAEAFGIFWTNPMNGVVAPCEAYTIDADGNMTSGDESDAATVAYAEGRPFKTFEGYELIAQALAAAKSYGPNYSVRILPAGTHFHMRDRARTLAVVGKVQPDPSHKPFFVSATIRGIPVLSDTIMAASHGAAIEIWRNHFAERADKVRASYHTFNDMNRGIADRLLKLMDEQAIEASRNGVEFSARPSRARLVDRVA